MSNTIGILGAGVVGRQLAQYALGAGQQVMVANSRGPDTLGDLVAR